jgi:hypothetical protein
MRSKTPANTLLPIGAERQVIDAIGGRNDQL